MKYMCEDVIFILIVSVFCLVIGGFYGSVSQRMKDEESAVKAGVAEYDADENGKMIFKYKVIPLPKDTYNNEQTNKIFKMV